MIPDILSFSSLTSFLAAFVAAKKSEDPLWSIAKWAKLLGLKSTTSISLVINGKRKCGRRIGQALQSYFQFGELQIQHFEYLVANSKAQGSGSIAKLFETEIRARASSKKTVVLDETQMAQIGSWYSFSLRQLSRIRPLHRDEDWLCSQLAIAKGTHGLVAALDRLVELGFLEEFEGVYRATDVVLTTQQNVSSDSIKRYHEEMGTLGIQAVRKFGVDQRSFQGCTLKVQSKETAAAKRLIEKFISDFEALTDADDGDSIYQMNVQFFPLVAPHA